MKILVTGACGFVGFSLVKTWRENNPDIEIIGIDNLSRAGSEINRPALKALGVRLIHGDIRKASDFESLPEVDWVVDAAANPSVLAGVDGQTSSRQLLEHNLVGTIEILEFCRKRRCGFILLSTSRVYGVEPLAGMKVSVVGKRFVPEVGDIPGLSAYGVDEGFSTEPPLSLYGTSKRAAELLALEYGDAFGFPVWINRCGVMAGAGQFGKADQGIISFWIHSWRARAPLKYIGFGGSGCQVRDFFSPRDLIPILDKQMGACGSTSAPRVMNLGGGLDLSFSLAELSDWCEERFGAHPVAGSPDVRPFDIPWMVMDTRLAGKVWGWQPGIGRGELLEEIARHAEAYPAWLELSR